MALTNGPAKTSRRGSRFGPSWMLRSEQTTGGKERSARHALRHGRPLLSRRPRGWPSPASQVFGRPQKARKHNGVKAPREGREDDTRRCLVRGCRWSACCRRAVAACCWERLRESVWPWAQYSTPSSARYRRRPCAAAAPYHAQSGRNWRCLAADSSSGGREKRLPALPRTYISRPKNCHRPSRYSSWRRAAAAGRDPHLAHRGPERRLPAGRLGQECCPQREDSVAQFRQSRRQAETPELSAARPLCFASRSVLLAFASWLESLPCRLLGYAPGLTRYAEIDILRQLHKGAHPDHAAENPAWLDGGRSSGDLAVEIADVQGFAAFHAGRFRRASQRL